MARVMMNEQWLNVINDFERHYPKIAEEVIDWYPVNQNEIIVKTRDGSKYTYTFVGNKLIQFYDSNDKNEFDEATWKDEFSNRLQRKMLTLHITQDELSVRTGISKVSLSRYMNGKASPSAYNLQRIADALYCSVSELMNGKPV